MEILFSRISTKTEKIDNGDKTYLGSGLPDLTYGLNLGAEYKGFDLSAFVYGASGNKIYDATVRPGCQLYKQTGLLPEDAGAPANVLGSGGTGTTQTDVSDYYVKDASFAKLKTLTLGYSLPTVPALSHIHLSRVRFYVTGQNLFVTTKIQRDRS